MITPSELRQYEFKSAGRNAYKSDDVDLLFGQILVDYEKMYRENSELIKRVSLLADKLEQYKKDEVDIKQAVLSAQKAADIIVRDAEESVADAKAEAEAILAAAKGEAQIIISDAEKQAIADSDLLLSIARDKAEEILSKAKEKSHEIIIDANSKASDKVGAATRTITSESLHYDMLKKEVSEFRASILAQYKTHIELISKLPELALEEAAKMDFSAEEEYEQTASENDVDTYEENVENTTECDDEIVIALDDDSADVAEDDVIPYSFSNEDVSEEEAIVETVDETISDEYIMEDSEVADISISKRLAIAADDLDFDGFDDDDEVKADDESIAIDDDFAEDYINPIVDEDADAQSSFFNSIESIEADNSDDGGKRKFGFFYRRK